MKTQTSDPTLCHCKKDKHGHEPIPFPIYVEDKLILGCPAMSLRRAARLNAELWVANGLEGDIPTTYQPTPRIQYHPDRKVLRAIGLKVNYPVPKWARQYKPTQPRSK